MNPTYFRFFSPPVAVTGLGGSATAVLAIAALCLVTLAGCEGRGDEPAPQPRPVTVTALEDTAPARAARRTGSVQAWKQEQIGFDVGGRVAWTIEEGSEVEPDIRDEHGEIIEEGTVVAQLDEARYQLRLNQARAKVRSIDARLEAAGIEIEQVLPRKLDEARAELDHAARQRERFAALLEDEATTQARFDEVDARARAAEARLEQLRGQRLSARADMLALEARRAEAREGVAQAERDLADCTLRAPFPGRIAKTHVIVGGFVSAGKPVASLVMMDPIEVELAISADTDRRINQGDSVMLFPAGSEQPLRGVVHRKDTVADPATRTFRLTAMVRNRRIVTDIREPEQLERLLSDPLLNRDTVNEALAEIIEDERLAERIRERDQADEALNAQLIDRILTDEAVRDRFRRVAEALPRIGGYHRLERGDAAQVDRPAEFIEQRALHRDEDGEWYAWRIANRQHGEPHKALLVLERVAVEPADEVRSLDGLATFRRLQDRGELGDEDLVAVDVPEDELEASDHVAAMLRQRWLLRPGEPVPIALEGDRAPRGLYAPVSAIIRDGDDACVFIIDDREEPLQARRIAVRVREGHGEMKRIEPMANDALAPGVLLVNKGAHYLVDGEPVSIAGREELAP